MDRDELIEAVQAAWEAHVESLPYEHRAYWWESAPGRDVAALAVDAVLAAQEG